MSDPPLPFATRLWFAWSCFFRVLFDPLFAGGVWTVSERTAGRLPPAPEPPRAEEKLKPEPKPVPAVPAPPPSDAALQLLALLQREGRLVDFLEQDVTSFPDAEIGAAARVVHDGCRKAIRSHVEIAPVRAEEEGTRVTIAAGFAPSEIKLSGNVSGAGPFQGVVRHRGWKVNAVTLPTPVTGHDARILAPAEVEL